MTNISHDQARLYINALLDGVITDQELKTLDGHLNTCGGCREYDAQLRDLEARLKRSFQRRWGNSPSPSENIIGNVQSQRRGIKVEIRFKSIMNILVGAAAILVLVLILNYLFQQLQKPSSTSITMVSTQAIPASGELPTPPENPPAACPITRPPTKPFIPPAPYPAEPPSVYGSQFWYGTADLWTMLSDDGNWSALPLSDSGYSQKIFWWRQGYKSDSEPVPKFKVTGKRLDAPAPSFLTSRATNAQADFGTAMLTGVNIPTLGCWEITGQYNGHELSFIVLVSP